MLMNPVHAEQQLIYDNLKSCFSLISGNVTHIEEAILLYSGKAFPLFNAIFAHQMQARIDEQTLQKAKAHYQELNVPFTYWGISADEPEENAHYAAYQQPSFAGMILDLQAHQAEPVNDEALHFKRATCPADIKIFSKIIETCFDFNAEMARFYYQAMLRLVDHPQFQHYIVYKNDLAIGTGTVFIENDVCGFYNLGVLPQYRQKGVGENIQKFRLQQAMELEAKHVILQASPMAEHINISVGFETIMHFTPYVFPS